MDDIIRDFDALGVVGIIIAMIKSKINGIKNNTNLLIKLFIIIFFKIESI